MSRLELWYYFLMSIRPFLVTAVPLPLLIQDREMENPKDRAGRNKARLGLVPAVAFIYESEVMRQGSEQYGEYNWRDTEVNSAVYYDACMRHLLAYWEGQDIDPDSGMPHMAHVRANAGIIMDAEHHGTLVDGRPGTRNSAAARVLSLVHEMRNAK